MWLELRDLEAQLLYCHLLLIPPAPSTLNPFACYQQIKTEEKLKHLVGIALLCPVFVLYSQSLLHTHRSYFYKSGLTFLFLLPAQPGLLDPLESNTVSLPAL